MLLAQLPWLSSICVIACRVNKHYCNFPKSVLYSGSMKSRVSAELTAVNCCWKLYFVVWRRLSLQTGWHTFCCLASLDFLCFFFLSTISSIFINTYIPVVWSSGGQQIYGWKARSFLPSTTLKNNSFLCTWIQLQCCFPSLPLYLTCC